MFYNDYVFEIFEGPPTMSFGDRHFSIVFNKGKSHSDHNIIAFFRFKQIPSLRLWSGLRHVLKISAAA